MGQKSLEIRADTQKMQQHQGCQAQSEAGLNILSMTHMPENEKGKKKRKKRQEFSSPCAVPGYSDMDSVAVNHVPSP